MCERPTGIDANQWAIALEKSAERKGVSVAELLPPIDIWKKGVYSRTRAGMKGTIHPTLKPEK